MTFLPHHIQTFKWSMQENQQQIPRVQNREASMASDVTLIKSDGVTAGGAALDATCKEVS